MRGVDVTNSQQPGPAGEPTPGVPAPGQQYPGQPYPPQQYPPQQYPPQQYPGQPYGGQPQQPYPGQPMPGQPYAGQPQQPYPGQPYPGQQPYRPAGQPPGKPKGKGGLILGITGGVAVLAVIASFLVPGNPVLPVTPQLPTITAGIPSAPASVPGGSVTPVTQADSAQAAVQGYLQAVSSGDSASAIAYAATPPMEQSFSPTRCLQRTRRWRRSPTSPSPRGRAATTRASRRPTTSAAHR